MNVSVCLAAYNGELYIKEQIDSILPQLMEGDEFLVADDGSSDGTLNIIRSYQDRITRIFDGRSGGVNRNFERLIMNSKNPVIVLADQDDVWLPERLLKIRTALEGHDLVMTNGYIVDKDLQLTGKTVFEGVGQSSGFISNLYKNTYVGCCLAFKKKIIKNALPFDTKLHAHDWLIALLGELRGKVCRIEEPCILYRRHGSNSSETADVSRNSLMQKILIRIEILRIIITCLLRTLYDDNASLIRKDI